MTFKIGRDADNVVNWRSQVWRKKRQKENRLKALRKAAALSFTFVFPRLHVRFSSKHQPIFWSIMRFRKGHHGSRV